ncbi:GNAT family N-acetyltransferase [Arthrobacter rhizosphaerae]|uniref:GNAT family N-acetyltransferase n=1 Tax=Arthrobacter rhizosphaerae TaxID=2855490 RepID=UPI001FF5C18F|nr:GNAT family N-acetyltransferase [Arthrobacter rhizosphaerae]
MATGPSTANLAMPEFEALMDAAWPATERHDTGHWVFRAASGVTQRANSVWVRDTAADEPAAMRDAVQWYRRNRLPVIYQLTEEARDRRNQRYESLNALLDAEGFTRQSETLVMHLDCASVRSAPDAGVEVLPEPSEEWLQLWWSVDGRGGYEELAVAGRILTGCPALYALVRDDDGVPAAVGRLALAGGYGGLYCMATRPDARRLGYARRIINALLCEGRTHGVSGYWLMVTASNSAGQQLYRQAGFTEAGRYVYRQERPKRHLTGC